MFALTTFTMFAVAIALPELMAAPPSPSPPVIALLPELAATLSAVEASAVLACPEVIEGVELAVTLIGTACGVVVAPACGELVEAVDVATRPDGATSAACGELVEAIDDASATLAVLILAVVCALALAVARSEEHTSELQSPDHLVCRLLLEKKKLSL